MTGEPDTFDLLVVGAGAAGLAAAIRADELGLRVCVLEAADRIGGATAYSGGQVWVGVNHLMEQEGLTDSDDEVKAYIRGIAVPDAPLDEAVLHQWVTSAPDVVARLEQSGAVRWEIMREYADYYYPQVPGSRAIGRYLVAAPFDGSSLGALRDRLLTSVHLPVGITYAEASELGTDRRALGERIAHRRELDTLTFGTGLIAHLLRQAVTRGITLLTGHRVTHLRQDARDRVVGVQVATPAGDETLHGPVVLAAGAHDWNDEVVAELAGIEPSQVASVAPTGIRGDAIGLARTAGAQIAKLPPGAGFYVAGYAVGPGDGHDAGFRGAGELKFPHAIAVNRYGERFCDESFWPSLTSAVTLDPDRNLPMFMVWDEQHHATYGLGSCPPGRPYPEHLDVRSAATLPELGQLLGLEDPEAFADNVRAFNDAARHGEDPAHGRGTVTMMRQRGDPHAAVHPVLGPLDQPPFYAMPLTLLASGMGAGGVRAGCDGRALDAGGAPIEGLYAVGAAAAVPLGGGYNSGFSLSRGITFGTLAAEHVARSGQQGR